MKLCYIELKNKNKKGQNEMVKWESLKRKKNYKFDDSYLLLFVYTLSTTITIKKSSTFIIYIV